MTKTLWMMTAIPALMLAQVPNPTQRGTARTTPARTSPLYQVNVVGSDTVAINYANRRDQTKVGFEGTVLLPRAEGEAKVRGQQGAAQIEAKFKDLTEPTRFGGQYLTYVLWALTPDGRAENLGQIVTDRKDRGRLNASTQLQTFGLIVTAEPYYSVTQPSDVVVMKNVVLPETRGSVETVNVKSELLSRGQFTYRVSQAEPATERRKVGKDEYEALLELYQAQNAVNIARSRGAEQFAADTFRRAEALLQQAEANYAAKSFDRVVSTARAASQTAEDARIVATKRQEERTASGAGVAAVNE
jgi:hypothetical protein